VDVDDASVQKMVEESVEHAFDDLAARRWVEAKLKAGELINATHKALNDAATDLSLENRAEVETALRAVEACAASENPDTKTGDTNRLQGACAALDEATRPLAELLMDRAMEAMLRKRGVIQ
jgi:molecular chaperone DnaK (HSP70)